MKNKIVSILKRIVTSFLLLYGLNYLLSSMQIMIPINLITISVVSLLGIPGLSSLIILFFIVQ